MNEYSNPTQNLHHSDCGVYRCASHSCSHIGSSTVQIPYLSIRSEIRYEMKCVCVCVCVCVFVCVVCVYVCMYRPTAQGASGWLVRRGSGSSPGQSMWDLSHCDRMVSDSFCFPLSLSFHLYFIFFFILNPHLSGRQNGRNLATLQQCYAVSEIVEHHGGKVHSLLLQMPVYYIIIEIWIT